MKKEKTGMEIKNVKNVVSFVLIYFKFTFTYVKNTQQKHNGQYKHNH